MRAVEVPAGFMVGTNVAVWISPRYSNICLWGPAGWPTAFSKICSNRSDVGVGKNGEIVDDGDHRADGATLRRSFTAQV